MDTGDLDHAIADYTASIQINPQFKLAYGNRSDAYAKKGDAARAKADREMAAQLAASP
jgi:tetratricopeptide (TPR) repeat protein